MSLRITRSILLAAILVTAPVFGRTSPPTLTFISPCVTQGQHGVDRWTAKTALGAGSIDLDAPAPRP